MPVLPVYVYTINGETFVQENPGTAQPDQTATYQHLQMTYSDDHFDGMKIYKNVVELDNNEEIV